MYAKGQVNIFRATQKQISSLYLAFSNWEFHLAFTFDLPLLYSRSTTKSGGVNPSFLRTCEFAPENCSWAISSFSPMNAVCHPYAALKCYSLNWWLAEACFTQISNDKTFHFNPVTLSQSYSYKEQDLASFFFSGKIRWWRSAWCASVSGDVLYVVSWTVF